MDNLSIETVRNLGAAFAEFQHTPSARHWTFLVSQMAEYQAQWNHLQERQNVERENTRRDLMRLTEYEYK